MLCVDVKSAQNLLFDHIFQRETFFIIRSPELKQLTSVLGLPSPCNDSLEKKQMSTH